MHRPLIARKVDTTDGSTAVTIALDPVRGGEVLLVRDYSLFNESGESVTVQPGFLTQGGFVGFDGAYTVADGAGFASYYVHKYLRENESMAMKVTGSAKSSKVTMVVSGDVYALEQLAAIVLEPAPPPAAGA